MQTDIKKSQFSVTEIKFLGFIILITRLRMDPEKVKTVVNWETPTNVKVVRSFLGFINFFRRFLKNHGRIRKPLVRLTKKNMPFKFG